MEISLAHGKEAITLPIYPHLNIEDQYYIINSIKNIIMNKDRNNSR